MIDKSLQTLGGVTKQISSASAFSQFLESLKY